ncbi:MAG: glycosyltransferase family 4 protein [Solirubrobacteraceae bacterium]
MRTLYVSTFAPTLGSGRALRTYTCIKALASLEPVDLLYIPHGGEHPAAEYEAIEDLEMIEVEPSRGPRRAVFYASKRARGIPDAFSRGAHPELLDVTRRMLERGEHDRVVLGDLNVAAVLLPLAARHPITYNAHNVIGAYRTPHSRLRPLAGASARAFERRLLNRVAESWVVSELDLQTARNLAPTARLRYVPNVVDVAEIEPVPPFPRGGGVLMVGDFLYPPNQLGRSFLVEEVMPTVWRAAPETRLTLVGRSLESWEAGDSRVEVRGFVEDLPAVYRSCDCVAVPLMVGGGTPLKFVEALAYRLPVVATPFAARGLDVVAGRHYREGADAEPFAAGILDVLGDGATAMAAQGRALAEREYSVQALARLIAA